MSRSALKLIYASAYSRVLMIESLVARPWPCCFSRILVPRMRLSSWANEIVRSSTVLACRDDGRWWVSKILRKDKTGNEECQPDSLDLALAFWKPLISKGPFSHRAASSTSDLLHIYSFSIFASGLPIFTRISINKLHASVNIQSYYCTTCLAIYFIDKLL